MEEKQISEQESLLLIQQMIDRARSSIIDKGTWPIYWGALIAFCSLTLYAEIKLGKFLPFDIFLLTLPALVIQIIIIAYNKRKNKGKPKPVGQSQKAIMLTWTAFAIGMILISFSKGGNSPIVYFVLYGTPTFVTGALINFRPMTIGGIICWLCAILVIVLNISSATNLLLVAICAIFAWLIPGIILRRRYLRAKQANHV